MKPTILAVTLAVALTSQARAADAELSTDAKRMLAYGTLAIMTGACKTSLTPDQDAKLKNGLEQAAEAQQDLSPEQFKDLMKQAGAQIGQNLAQVCANLTPDFINTSLEQAAAGE